MMLTALPPTTPTRAGKTGFSLSAARVQTAPAFGGLFSRGDSYDSAASEPKPGFIKRLAQRTWQVITWPFRLPFRALGWVAGKISNLFERWGWKKPTTDEDTQKVGGLTRAFKESESPIFQVRLPGVAEPLDFQKGRIHALFNDVGIEHAGDGKDNNGTYLVDVLRGSAHEKQYVTAFAKRLSQKRIDRATEKTVEILKYIADPKNAVTAGSPIPLAGNHTLAELQPYLIALQHQSSLHGETAIKGIRGTTEEEALSRLWLNAAGDKKTDVFAIPDAAPKLEQEHPFGPAEPSKLMGVQIGDTYFETQRIQGAFFSAATPYTRDKELVAACDLFKKPVSIAQILEARDKFVAVLRAYAKDASTPLPVGLNDSLLRDHLENLAQPTIWNVTKSRQLLNLFITP